MPETWYKVDNVAKVFLASVSRRDPRVFRVSCTLNEDVDADGYADERADEQVDKRRCCADGGKGRAAGKFADDNDVGGVEQQL